MKAIAPNVLLLLMLATVYPNDYGRQSFHSTSQFYNAHIYGKYQLNEPVTRSKTQVSLNQNGIAQRLKIRNGLEPGAVASGSTPTMSPVEAWQIRRSLFSRRHPVATAHGSNSSSATFVFDSLSKANQTPSPLPQSTPTPQPAPSVPLAGGGHATESSFRLIRSTSGGKVVQEGSRFVVLSNGGVTGRSTK